MKRSVEKQKDGDDDAKRARTLSSISISAHQQSSEETCEWLPSSNLHKWSLSLSNSTTKERSRAIACIRAFLDVVVANGEGNLLFNILADQLQAEEDASVAQQIVSLITSLALVQEVSLQQGEVEPFLQTLINYFIAQFSQPCRHNSSLKLHILLCLGRMAKAKREIDLGILNTKLLEVLPCSSARLRTQVLHLLAATVKHKQQGETERSINHIMQALQDCMKDPHPCVREAALEAVSKLHTKGYSMTRESFKHVYLLLQDSYEGVRISAIQAIQIWTEFRQELEEELEYYDVNFAFLQVSAMLTDMNIKVRLKACDALGRMKGVSEDILLQALNKKSLFPSEKEKERLISFGSITKGKTKEFAAQEEDLDILLRSISGVFVQAIEDEFFEVRQAAVLALGRLNEGSEKLLCCIQDLLVDMLNDDSRFVRMEIVKVLFQMACKSRVTMNENHLHMLHGMLEDSSLEMRSAMRMLLGKIKLQNLSCFRFMLQALLNDVNKHGQDNGIIHTFYSLGRGESSYVQIAVEDLLQEVKTLLINDVGLDKSECRALVALFVAAAQSSLCIPSLIPNQLLSCSRLLMNSLPPKASATTLELIGPKVQIFKWNVNSSRHESKHLMSKSCSQQAVDEFRKDASDLDIKKEQFHGLLVNMVKTMNEVKSLLDAGMFHATQKVLSGCRRNLKQLSERAEDMKSTVSFVSLYLDCLFMLKQGWAFFHSKKSKARLHASTFTDKLCHKLQYLVIRMKYTFYEHTEQQSFLLLELGIIPYIWRIACEDHANVKLYHSHLKSIFVLAGKLSKNGLSYFMQEVKQRIFASLDDQNIVKGQEEAQHLASHYWPEISSDLYSVNELQADITTPGVDFEHPVCFMPGLPLGLALSVAFNSVATDCRMWVCSILGTNGPQYTFLDHKDKIDSASCMTIMLKIYGTPNVAKCIVNIVLLLECPVDKPFQIGPRRGPTGHLVPISDQKIVHLISAQAFSSRNRLLI